MASISKWNPFGVALDLTATAGTITRTSATEFTVEINASWEVYWSGNNTNYGMTASSGGSSVTLNKFGTYSSKGSGSFVGTYSISGNSAATKTITVTFKNFNSDNGKSATKTINLSVKVPAWTSYTVKYNANGGSGAPSTQTKWKDQALTLSTTKPTRAGHSFQGWATSASGSVAYAAGAKYTANASVTLYAIWKANTYTVSYNANGGSGAPGSQTKTYGVALTLSSTKPTRTNYAFKGWATSASGSVAYAAGASYTSNANITLYAVWELAYTKPRITGLSVKRCDSSGTVKGDGTYALVKFSWACDKSVSSIKIEWKPSMSSGYTSSATVSASGTSGSVSKTIGGGAFGTESTYMIRVTVTDSAGSFSKTVTLNSLAFTIHARSGGNGVAFGKTAELDGYADFAYKTRHRNHAIFENTQGIYGATADGTDIHLMNLNANNNLVIGYGGYDKKLGTTNIYGNAINLQSNDGIKVEGRKIATNKVLWSGAYFMHDTQTCTLSEAVTAQANGVFLVWSEYDTDKAEAVNANFNITFIPRRFVSSHAGKGVSTHCVSATGNVQASKYVYINDTTITGYANNGTAAYEADCGITMSPKKFVLRYVIGV
jgi:uncharacterized repeat protein (TIGR02543 family)